MSAKAWKAIEKRIAEWLSNSVIQATRKSNHYLGEAVEDIEWGPISVEVKSRGLVPKYIDVWLDQAAHNAGGKIPVVFWHRDGMHVGEQFVIIRAHEFKHMIEDWKGEHADKQHEPNK